MRSTSIAASLTVGLLLTGCGSRDGDAAKPSTSPSPVSASPLEETPTPTKDALKEAEEAFEASIADLEDSLGESIGVHEGTYKVTNFQPEYEDVTRALDDEYIAPGTYTTKGLSDGSISCYWARLRDASGQSGSIIANDITKGRATVTVEEGEFFKTSGCKPWTGSGG
ncbi:hypothetical protein [Streptomyces galilaeus]|uniref:hypothetical protein n=1 Tax=Streptomyces galilaeus TaxID=33899 RepID=UPI00123DE500|nr:hypothetical protein [Streptomyces galilaeus]GGW47334.1 hypothetical protein GCM10010350_34300 [Streptomyces galilaeus]